MKALIRQKDGKFYTSKIFAIFNDKLDDKWKAGYFYKFLVLNKDGTNLILQDEYDQNSKYINKFVLIYDTDKTDMNLDSNGLGKVNFLTESEIEILLSPQDISSELIEKCLAHKIDYEENDFIKIENQKDIDNLMAVSGGFHDAKIKRLTDDEDGVTVLFDGIWGCNIEMNFTGYCDYVINADEGNKWWYDSYMEIRKTSTGNVIYFSNQEDINSEESKCYSTWFLAQNVKYRIIPNE